jgi:hypothetical protein
MVIDVGRFVVYMSAKKVDDLTIITISWWIDLKWYKYWLSWKIENVNVKPIDVSEDIMSGVNVAKIKLIIINTLWWCYVEKV